MANPKDADRRVKNWEKDNQEKIREVKGNIVTPPKKGEVNPAKETPEQREQRQADQKVAREKQAKHNWQVGRRNQLMSDLKQIDERGSPEADDAESKRGINLLDTARLRAEGKKSKFRDEIPRSSWNAGFDKRLNQRDFQLKRGVGEDGRPTANWEKRPEMKDERQLREEKARSRKVNRGIRGFKDLELAKKPVGVQVENKLDDLKSYLKWMDGGGSDEEGLDKTLSLLMTELDKFGHTDLSERLSQAKDTKDVKEFVKLMNARLGIIERREIPDLVAGKVLFPDGHEEIAYHMPTPSAPKKLKIRPGYIAEDKERPHGHEGREDEPVKQKMWTKDPDFEKVKGGIINRGDYKFDPNAEITEVKVRNSGESTNNFAIARYSDGSRAFIKSSEQKLVRNEYGASKVFNTLLADKTNISIPNSNVIPVNKMNNEEIVNSLGGEFFIRNEYVNGYPAGTVGDELISKIKLENMIDSWTISQLFGDSDFHLDNLLVDAEGNLTKIDNAHTMNRILDPMSDIYQPNFFHQALVDYYVISQNLDDFDSEEFNYWIEENKELFAKSFKKFIEGNRDKLIYEIMQNSLIDDSNVDEIEEILNENFDVLETYFFGTEDDLNNKQEWWDTVYEERYDQASKEIEEATGREAQEGEDTTQGVGGVDVREDEPVDTERLAEVLGNAKQANEMVDRIRQQVENELKQKYELVPKEEQEEQHPEEPQTYEKPEPEAPRYTMDDLFTENMKRLQSGKPQYESIEDMIRDLHPDDEIMDEIPEDATIVEPEQKKPKKVEPVRFNPKGQEIEKPEKEEEQEVPDKPIKDMTREELLRKIRMETVDRALDDAIEEDENGNLGFSLHKLKQWRNKNDIEEE